MTAAAQHPQSAVSFRNDKLCRRAAALRRPEPPTLILSDVRIKKVARDCAEFRQDLLVVKH